MGRERGLLNLIAAVFQDSPTSEQEVYQLAQARLNEAAKASDLARWSQENTRQMLTTLGRSLGLSTSQSPSRRSFALAQVEPDTNASVRGAPIRPCFYSTGHHRPNESDQCQRRVVIPLSWEDGERRTTGASTP